MIVDAQNNFSSAQVVTASAVSANTIDLSQARDVGTGATLYAVITVDANVTAAGAGTVTFQVISSAAADLSSPTILGQTNAIGKAELPAGRRPIVIEVPSTVLAAQPIGQRYLGLQYTVGTGPLTGGSFTANLVKDAQDIGKYYPSGFTVA